MMTLVFSRLRLFATSDGPGFVLGRLAVFVTIGVVGACGGAPSPPSLPRPSLLDTATHTTTAYPTPAEWRYHPRDAAPLLSQVVLSDGRVLSAGQRGERWLVEPKAGVAEAASETAPEDLIAIVPSKDGWQFLGKSGTSYEAREPLGAFVRSNAPLEPLVRVRTSGSVLIGVRRDGALLRSDSAGAAWTRVGPDATRFEDVRMRADGRGLALAVPEALWETRDAGTTFQRVAVPSMGADDLAMDATDIVVVTPLGARRWLPDAGVPFPALGRLMQPPAYPLGASPPLGPSAAALVDGRAIVVDDGFVEARPTANAGAWQLLTGRVGARLAAAPLVPAHGCVDVRMAGFGTTLYLACARQHVPPNVTEPFEIHRSVDSGKTWAVEPYVVDGQMGSLALSAGPDDDSSSFPASAPRRLEVQGVFRAASRFVVRPTRTAARAWRSFLRRPRRLPGRRRDSCFRSTVAPRMRSGGARRAKPFRCSCRTTAATRSRRVTSTRSRCRRRTSSAVARPTRSRRLPRRRMAPSRSW